MRELLLVGALALSAGLFSQASRADDTGHVNDTRFYARASVSRSDLSNSRFYDGESDTSAGISLGWRFLPWLAVEAGYSDLGDFRFSCPAGFGCIAVVQPPFEVDGVELGLAARVPFGESGLFGQARAGVIRWDSGADSEIDPYYGVGVGYAFNERFSLSLNFDRYDLGQRGRQPPRTRF